MSLFVLAIVILAALAVSGLVVGVSNDAVNFLNSSFGSRVAPRRVVLIVASLGIMAGVTFSSGMMEVARKGIFNPQFFTMPELMVAFLAVMLTNTVLLDLFNTYGLPTSTTVAIVFGLLGAAVGVSLLKLSQEGENLSRLVEYINTGKALAIISGILVSVAVAFFAGAAIQVLTRTLFTFDYEKRLRRYGGLWGGAALALIVYFILIKGAKGASFLTDEAVAWITGNTGVLLVGTFAVCAVLLQLLLVLTRVNILKIIVLAGTFALAMAFAANDLVNFIGVPLAGLASFKVATASSDPMGLPMEALRQPIRSNAIYLLLAGAIMVATLWLSRKARTVTKTEVRLGRQDEGYERFESTVLSQTIVRLVAGLLDGLGRLIPAVARRRLARRLDRSHYRPAPGPDGVVPSFDLVRASVNLMVASALIAFGTSLKLPLSTTYVTFMVAMGTSLSDQAWGRDSAVFRVSGVLTVIGGWFFTAMMAFTVSLAFAAIIFFGRELAVLGVVALAVIVFIRSHRLHQKRVEKEKAIEVFNLRKIKDSTAAMRVTFEHAGHFLAEVARELDAALTGLFALDRQRLKEARSSQRQIQTWSNIIAANTFKVLRLLQWEEVENTQRYAETISSLQEISESVRDIVMRAHVHVSNNHSGLLEAQVAEMDAVRRALVELLQRASEAMLSGTEPDLGFLKAKYRELRVLIHEYDHNQIMRIQDNSSKTRLSILFYGCTWDCLKIAEQTLHLMTVFHDPLQPWSPKPVTPKPLAPAPSVP